MVENQILLSNGCLLVCRSPLQTKEAAGTSLQVPQCPVFLAGWARISPVGLLEIAHLLTHSSPEEEHQQLQGGNFFPLRCSTAQPCPRKAAPAVRIFSTHLRLKLSLLFCSNLLPGTSRGRTWARREWEAADTKRQPGTTATGAAERAEIKRGRDALGRQISEIQKRRGAVLRKWQRNLARDQPGSVFC